MDTFHVPDYNHLFNPYRFHLGDKVKLKKDHDYLKKGTELIVAGVSLHNDDLICEELCSVGGYWINQNDLEAQNVE